MVGCHAWSRAGFVEGMLRLPSQWREERRIRETALHTLELVGLADRASAPAASFRSASSACSPSPAPCPRDPRVLLLDEPAAGLRGAEKGSSSRPSRRCARAG